MLRVRAECDARTRGEETPRRLPRGDEPVAVADVIDHRFAPDHGDFKVLGADRATDILHHRARSGRWEPVMFDSPTAPAGNAAKGRTARRSSR